MDVPPTATREPVGFALRRARQHRRWSQLELAHRLGVSQRHVSFVECGRARPGRALLGAWLEALDVPLATRNVVLTQAGYAPAYSEAPLGAPEVAVVTEAMHRLLAAHDPWPAVVLDSDWDIVETNQGFDWLLGAVVDGEPERGSLNLVDLMTSETGFLGRVVNVAEAARVFVAQLRHEAQTNPGLAQRLDTLLAGLAATGLDPAAPEQPSAFAVIPLRLNSEHGELAFFTMFTTLGAPHSVTAASLRVEHLFPLDEHTRQVMKHQVASRRAPEALSATSTSLT